MNAIAWFAAGIASVLAYQWAGRKAVAMYETWHRHQYGPRCEICGQYAPFISFSMRVKADGDNELTNAIQLCGACVKESQELSATSEP